MLHLYCNNLLNCFCSIVKLLILCSHVFVNVSENRPHDLRSFSWIVDSHHVRFWVMCCDSPM